MTLWFLFFIAVVSATLFACVIGKYGWDDSDLFFEEKNDKDMWQGLIIIGIIVSGILYALLVMPWWVNVGALFFGAVMFVNDSHHRTIRLFTDWIYKNKIGEEHRPYIMRLQEEYDETYQHWQENRDKYKPAEQFKSLANKTLLPTLSPDLSPSISRFLDAFVKQPLLGARFEKYEINSSLFPSPISKRDISDALFKKTNIKYIRDALLFPVLADEFEEKCNTFFSQITPALQKLPVNNFIEDPFLILDATLYDEDGLCEFIDAFLNPLLPTTHSILGVPDTFGGWVWNQIRLNIDAHFDAPKLLRSPHIARCASLRGIVEHHIPNTETDTSIYVTKPVGNYVQTPLEHLPTRQIMGMLLKGTGLETFIDSFAVPAYIPHEARLEHTHICAPTGTGKTTLLSNLLMKDLDGVANNAASVVVLDTKRDFIKSIEHMAVFGTGGALHNKLICIDVEDVEYPIALNIMDMGASTEGLSPLNKEIFRNSTLSMMNYFFNSLLGDGSELTSRQSTVFNFLIQLMMEIPQANLDTLLDILEMGVGKYSHYLTKLDSDGQRYFASQFNDGQAKRTRQELTSRIYSIKSNKTLSRMFSAPATKLNLFEELSAGRVILINCAKSILQEEVEVFGRFMLAMILLAAERRQLVERADRMPTFVYMDEAQDILKRDTRISTLLSQARGYNVGMIIAHQFADQLNPPVLKALSSQCAISVDTDETTPKYSFNVSCRGYGEGIFAPDNIAIEDLPAMTMQEHAKFQFLNREKYSYQADNAPVHRMTNEVPEDFDADKKSPFDHDPFSTN